MTNTLSFSERLSAVALLAYYDQWLTFLIASQRVTRQHEHQLLLISKCHLDLRHLSDYLCECMQQRTQFFERLAALLSSNADKLKADPTNEVLLGRLTQAHPALQLKMSQLIESFIDVKESYQTLQVSMVSPETVSLLPALSLQ